jgi:hypothetical protein
MQPQFLQWFTRIYPIVTDLLTRETAKEMMTHRLMRISATDLADVHWRENTSTRLPLANVSGWEVKTCHYDASKQFTSLLHKIVIRFIFSGSAVTWLMYTGVRILQ